MRKQAAESNPFVIRAARLDEAEAIVALIQRAFGEYRGKLRPESGALLETPDTIRAAMKTGTGRGRSQRGPAWPHPDRTRTGGRHA